MISAYLVDEWKVIVVFFLKKNDEEVKDARYTIAFYNYNLEHRNEIVFDWVVSEWVVSEPNSGNGIFFFCLHLHWRRGAYIYFKDKYGEDLNFEIKELAGSDKSYTLNHIIGKYFNKHYYAPHVNYNDFFKVDENRLVFITTKYPYNKIYFFIIDIYHSDSHLKIRKYSYTIPDAVHYEMQGYTYNGYIILVVCMKHFL